MLMDEVKEAIKVNDLIHKKAGEMIELIKLLRMDALKKKRLYMRLQKALESKDKGRIRAVHSELKSMRKLTFKL